VLGYYGTPENTEYKEPCKIGEFACKPIIKSGFEVKVIE
jgi:hypothetical protein